MRTAAAVLVVVLGLAFVMLLVTVDAPSIEDEDRTVTELHAPAESSGSARILLGAWLEREPPVVTGAERRAAASGAVAADRPSPSAVGDHGADVARLADRVAVGSASVASVLEMFDVALSSGRWESMQPDLSPEEGDEWITAVWLHPDAGDRDSWSRLVIGVEIEGRQVRTAELHWACRAGEATPRLRLSRAWTRSGEIGRVDGEAGVTGAIPMARFFVIEDLGRLVRLGPDRSLPFAALTMQSEALLGNEPQTVRRVLTQLGKMLKL